MKKADKELIWHRGTIKAPPFSKEARIEAGVLLRKLQTRREAVAAALAADAFHRTRLS